VLRSFAELKTPEHRALQPFGQIPTFQAGSLALFKSAAIVLHLAESHGKLLPNEADARARAIAWMFAAVGSVEPVVVARETLILLERNTPGFDDRLKSAEARIDARLAALSAWLGDKEWLNGAFSAADLVLISVLRRPSSAEQLPGFANLRAYVARGEARSAFGRAFAAQRAVFDASQAG
jgi:glutathione S-transferase